MLLKFWGVARKFYGERIIDITGVIVIIITKFVVVGVLDKFVLYYYS